ncbi:Putative uroporphyrinogen-III synthase [Geodia barretti]|jgi:uroporphyrinogen-III synthase|uniref:Uroporphyrinogen-III synthase n=1 Tax=Geodia barretti TaxID=519541 RepID=A0AA35WFB5_GEOBA|nr:Putative uroporphyrinogen-III synthase [Geodia barretti]
MTKASLNGRVLAFVEARMPDEMAGLIRRHGGVPMGAPVMQEHYRQDSPEVQQAIDDVCAGRVATVIFLTGVGAEAMMGIADGMGRLSEFEEALRGTTVVARSPKPGRILRRHKIPINIMPPEPYTSSDLIAAMKDLDLENNRVIYQRYGGPDSELPTYLREQRADYQELTLYDWGLPEDTAPVVDLIDRIEQGEVDALAFTSRPQVPNLMTIAANSGREASLRASLSGPVAVASVGPVCTRKLKEFGIPVDVEPDHPHMGNLVMAVAEYFGDAG